MRSHHTAVQQVHMLMAMAMINSLKKIPSVGTSVKSHRKQNVHSTPLVSEHLAMCNVQCGFKLIYKTFHKHIYFLKSTFTVSLKTGARKISTSRDVQCDAYLLGSSTNTILF